MSYIGSICMNGLEMCSFNIVFSLRCWNEIVLAACGFGLENVLNCIYGCGSKKFGI